MHCPKPPSVCGQRLRCIGWLGGLGGKTNTPWAPREAAGMPSFGLSQLWHADCSTSIEESLAKGGGTGGLTMNSVAERHML
jgi:hypothetical protein